MRFSILGSGSTGNSTILECGKTRLLIDAGLSAKQLSLRLGELGIDPNSLSAILITHEHGDHVRGLKTFLKQNPIPVYTTRDTAHVVREQGISDAKWHTFDAGQTFAISHLQIETFAVQHDAVDPIGFVIANESQRFGLLTDAGFVTSNIKEKLKNLSALFLEANYDDKLLEQDTKRPWATKQRIASRHGHLSNAQAEELIREIAHPELFQIVFGHLSSDCNCPKKIHQIFENCLREIGQSHIALHCATQNEASPWFVIQETFRLTA